MIDEYDYWCCPNCGWDTNNGDPAKESGQVTYSDVSPNVAAEMEHGGHCFDWTETWTCQECGTEFEFMNGSY